MVKIIIDYLKMMRKYVRCLGLCLAHCKHSVFINIIVSCLPVSFSLLLGFASNFLCEDTNLVKFLKVIYK